ncbi:MAG: DUF5686 and carboxypeptidase regulatory-like domain-containing protein [Tannerella sp.]|nr:DUF5686 and carboxypeptidase regulatory-like domain-containing protein [Tannerella sp.]
MNIKRAARSLLACCLFAAGVQAQTLHVRITDPGGVAVANAALYVRELAQGVMADDGGAVRLVLKEGSYTLDVSSLGYEKKTVAATVDRPLVTLTVVMDEKMYSLEEVSVSARREDPAYAVMRRAIGMAPYYLHQVKSYAAETYLKGTGKIEKIPALLKLNVNGRQLNDMVDRMFVVESQNEVTFTSPDKYEQRVLAVSSSLPSEADFGSMMSVTTSNIYSPKFGDDFISPLAPDAFSYYRFALDARSLEGARWISKIRITPRKKNYRLFSGWIYIVEDLWSVQFLDITTSMSGFTFRYHINYNEVKPSVFLPTAYDAYMTVDMMGLKAGGKYTASIQYRDLTLNDMPPVAAPAATLSPPAPVDRPRTPKQQKAQAKLDKLIDRDELTNRDAYRMAKLMRDVAEPEETRRQRDTLELLPAGNVRITVDSLAGKRDSLYWAEARVVPLLEDEIGSYRESDRRGRNADSAAANPGMEIALSTSGGRHSPANKILFGNTVNLGRGMRLSYKGLMGVVPEYNFVDGFHLGEKLVLESDPAKAASFSLTPSACYLTARRTVSWQVDALYRYAPLRGGRLTLSGGNITADFNLHDGNDRMIHSLASLFLAGNTIRFHQRKYIGAANQIDLASGLQLSAELSYETRNALENRTSYRFFGNAPSPNIPHGQTSPMPAHTALRTGIRLDYTPRHYYRIRHGRKYYEHSLYPTFTLRYEKGIPTGSASASFDRLEAGVRQHIATNAFDHFEYTVNAGAFLTARSVYFPDFKHFNTNELRISSASMYESFSLLDNYAFSTSRRWLQAHAGYNSMYLFLKNLPFLQRYLFEESVHMRMLWTPAGEYLEAGYSIGFGDVGRAGVFVGFDRRTYNGAGFTISLPLFRIL